MYGYERNTHKEQRARSHLDLAKLIDKQPSFSAQSGEISFPRVQSGPWRRRLPLSPFLLMSLSLPSQIPSFHESISSDKSFAKVDVCGESCFRYN